MVDTFWTQLGSPRGPAEGAAEWQIRGSPVNGVTLVSAIREGRHEIDIRDFERRLRLGVLWEWNDIRFRIREGLLTSERLDEAIHEGTVRGARLGGFISIPGPP